MENFIIRFINTLLWFTLLNVVLKVYERIVEKRDKYYISD